MDTIVFFGVCVIMVLAGATMIALADFIYMLKRTKELQDKINQKWEHWQTIRDKPRE